MRIHDANITGAPATETGRSSQTVAVSRGGSGGTQAASRYGDQVELSSAAGWVARASAAGSSPERTGKVAALAALYQSGNYQPDSGATSRAIVDHSLKLG